MLLYVYECNWTRSFSVITKNHNINHVASLWHKIKQNEKSTWTCTQNVQICIQTSLLQYSLVIFSVCNRHALSSYLSTDYGWTKIYLSDLKKESTCSFVIPSSLLSSYQISSLSRWYSPMSPCPHEWQWTRKSETDE